MHGLKMIPADQTWFWADSWQKGEREASEDIATGRTKFHETAENMFDHLAGDVSDARVRDDCAL